MATTQGAVRGRRLSGKLNLRQGTALALRQNLNLGALAQTGDLFALRFFQRIACHLIPNSLKGRKRLFPLFQQFDHMPAKLALHRLGDLTDIELESSLAKFRHHTILGEPAQITASGGIQLIGKSCKICAIL